MTDPLDAQLRDTLRLPPTPADPDPEFARSLRARIERALLHPQEAPMTTTYAPPTQIAQSLTPRLTTVDARAAVEFCVAAFGAVRRGEPYLLPDGSVANVEVVVGGQVVMLTEEYPEGNLVAPVTRGGASVTLRLGVPDPDAAVERALAAGAVLDSPVTDAPYGRSGAVLDPSGHRWVLARDVPTARPGDVVYASLWTPDVERAARFYAAVLGWEYAPDHDGRGRRVLGRQLGIFGGRPGLFLCYSVPDVDAAAAVVRAAGGTAGEPADEEHGRLAECVDDQGVPFALHTGPGSPVTEPGYTELRVPDDGRARAFYGAVLGTRYLPGSAPGYWHTADAAGGLERTTGGLSGGYPDAQAVPTFAVADLDAADAAVRAMGGTVDDSGPRGLQCTDDQGIPFALRAGQPAQ